MDALVFMENPGPAQQAIPLCFALARRGHTVRVIADGKAICACKKAGIKPEVEGLEDFPNTEDIHWEIGEARLTQLFSTPRPDVLILYPNGPPPSVEFELGKRANELGIPVVYGNDFWANFRRLKGEVELALTLELDDRGAELTRETLGESFSAVVVGNHGVVADEEPAPQTIEYITSARGGIGKDFKWVFTYFGPGEGHRTIPEAKILMESIAMTPMLKLGGWCLLPRPHPKLAKILDPNGRPWMEAIESFFKPFGDEHILWNTSEHQTRDLAMTCDVTFGGVSTDLACAISSGRQGVSLFPPETAAFLKAGPELDQFPLVGLDDLVWELREPQALTPILTAGSKDVSKLRPYDPEIAAAAIEALATNVAI